MIRFKKSSTATLILIMLLFALISIKYYENESSEITAINDIGIVVHSMFGYPIQ